MTNLMRGFGYIRMTMGMLNNTACLMVIELIFYLIVASNEAEWFGGSIELM